MNKTLTAKEILKVLEEKTDVHSFAYGDVDVDELGLGGITEVEQKGGEDEGTEWYSVKYFEEHGVYIRTDGYYTSYNGTDFEDGMGYEVTPQERTITVYE